MENSPISSHREDNLHHHSWRKRSASFAGPSLASSSLEGVFAGGKRDDSTDDEQFSLSNKTVLECPICLHPLTIPVFQCANGHISCSSCVEHLRRKCPLCSKKLGNLRNQAIESVLESIKVACSYGCGEKIIYCDKRLHEETCVYAPYECPFIGCVFSGSPRNLHMHLKKQHTSSVILLSLDIFCGVIVSKARDVFVILEKGDDGAIFILNLKGKSMGISCIQEPNLSKGHGFGYSLAVYLERGSFTSSFRVSSHTFPLRSDNVAKEKVDRTNYPLKDFVHALDYSLRDDECITLWLTMWSTKDESSVSST